MPARRLTPERDKLSAMVPVDPPTGDYEIDRQRQIEAMRKRIDEEVAWVGRSYDELRARRDERLRALVGHAQQHSPWHAGRLAGIDADTLSGDDLSALPIMTKHDLRDHWDDIVCDRSLTSAAARAHLDEAVAGRYAYFGHWNHLMSTGGSGGHPVLIPWDFDGWIDTYLMFVRQLVHEQQQAGGLPDFVSVVLGAAHPTHISSLITRCFSSDDDPIIELPATTPLDELVRRLNDLQPATIGGYSSLLADLAVEQLQGHLRVEPYVVITTSEPASPRQRQLIDEAFGALTIDKWASTEAGTVLAQTHPGSEGLVLVEDAAVFELVDKHHRPVAPGHRSHGVLVTNLVNKVLPLIRYEMDDETSLLDAPLAGEPPGRQIAPMTFRADSTLQWHDATSATRHRVRPEQLDAVICEGHAIGSYRVVQTHGGIEVTYRAAAAVDDEQLTDALTELLSTVGLRSPVVTVRAVDTLERNPVTAKLKAFNPLPKPQSVVGA